MPVLYDQTTILMTVLEHSRTPFLGSRVERDLGREIRGGRVVARRGLVPPRAPVSVDDCLI